MGIKEKEQVGEGFAAGFDVQETVGEVSERLKLNSVESDLARSQLVESNLSSVDFVSL
jgi:hypothetical protein